MYPQDAPTQARGWDEGNACAGTGTPIRQWTASPGRPPPPPPPSSLPMEPTHGLGCPSQRPPAPGSTAVSRGTSTSAPVRAAWTQGETPLQFICVMSSASPQPAKAERGETLSARGRRGCHHCSAPPKHPGGDRGGLAVASATVPGRSGSSPEPGDAEGAQGCAGETCSPESPTAGGSGTHSHGTAVTFTSASPPNPQSPLPSPARTAKALRNAAPTCAG